MSIARQIVVRYRAEGHVRFVVPRLFRHPEIARQLEEGLMRVDGVYRVDSYLRQGKLSIRFMQDVIDFQSLARALHEVVSRIEIPRPESESFPGTDLAARKEPSGAATWIRNKYRQAREALNVMGFIPGKAQVAKPILTAEREQIIIDFCTDLLVLYLIKLHWHLIMSHWIRRPWQYRGEWLATLYLIFLLVRSRKPK